MDPEVWAPKYFDLPNGRRYKAEHSGLEYKSTGPLDSNAKGGWHVTNVTGGKETYVDNFETFELVEQFLQLVSR